MNAACFTRIPPRTISGELLQQLNYSILPFFYFFLADYGEVSGEVVIVKSLSYMLLLMVPEQV